METQDDCRICYEQGQYNIFNDELSLDLKNNSKTKIYIVLNHFLYEKVNSNNFAVSIHNFFNLSFMLLTNIQR